MDSFVNRGWRDAVFLVIRHLNLAPSVGFINRVPDGIRGFIGIQQHLSIHVPSGAPRSLNERCFRSKETRAIRVKNRDKRHLGEIQTFPQEINSHDYIENTFSKFA